MPFPALSAPWRPLVLTLAAGLSAGASAQQAPELATAAQKYNYIIGYQLGRNVAERLQQQGVEIDAVAIGAGLADSLAEREPGVSQEEVMAAIQSLQANQQSARAVEAEANLSEGESFLEENSANDGVVVLGNGLQYLVQTAGTGAKPKSGATVLVHYRGTLLSGEEFDSSYQRGEPAKFSTDQVIPGFRDALTRMREGSKWRVFIPAHLAYGERGAGQAIGPNQTLIFELELIEVFND